MTHPVFSFFTLLRGERRKVKENITGEVSFYTRVCQRWFFAKMGFGESRKKKETEEEDRFTEVIGLREMETDSRKERRGRRKCEGMR